MIGAVVSCTLLRREGQPGGFRAFPVIQSLGLRVHFALISPHVLSRVATKGLPGIGGCEGRVHGPVRRPRHEVGGTLVRAVHWREFLITVSCSVRFNRREVEPSAGRRFLHSKLLFNVSKGHIGLFEEFLVYLVRLKGIARVAYVLGRRVGVLDVRVDLDVKSLITGMHGRLVKPLLPDLLLLQNICNRHRLLHPFQVKCFGGFLRAALGIHSVVKLVAQDELAQVFVLHI